MEKNKRKLNRL